MNSFIPNAAWLLSVASFILLMYGMMFYIIADAINLNRRYANPEQMQTSQVRIKSNKIIALRIMLVALVGIVFSSLNQYALHWF